MALENLQELYVEQLCDLYSAEKQILEALPEMADRATHAELKSGFELHERRPQEQVRRLEQIADSLGVKITGETCDGMKGLLREGDTDHKLTDLAERVVNLDAKRAD
jgi:ferritin-like metal-binding protein YciE